MKAFLFILLVSISSINGQESTSAPTSASDIRPILNGAMIPEGNLVTQDGKSVSLKSITQGNPSVLIFYRGGWCPFCNRHLSDLQYALPELNKLKISVIGISPDLPKNASKTSKKLNLGYSTYSDSSMELAKAFGIAFKVDEATIDKYKTYKIDLDSASGKSHHLLPVPSVFLVGADGQIKFSYVNPDYKTRLSSEVLLSAVQTML